MRTAVDITDCLALNTEPSMLLEINSMPASSWIYCIFHLLVVLKV